MFSQLFLHNYIFDTHYQRFKTKYLVLKANNVHNDIRKFFICMSFSMLCCRKNTTISNTQIDLFIYSTHHAYLYIIVYIFKLLLPCQSSLSFISMHFAVR